MSNVSITKHTKQGCGWCTRWDRDEKPWLSPAIKFAEIEGGANGYPTFVVKVGDKEKTLKGYQSIEKLQKAISELSPPPHNKSYL